MIKGLFFEWKIHVQVFFPKPSSFPRCSPQTWSHFAVEEEHDSCERFQPEFFHSKPMVFNHYLHHTFLIWEHIIPEILEEFVMMSHDTNTIKKFEKFHVGHLYCVIGSNK
jgi:hypothetical protein